MLITKADAVRKILNSNGRVFTVGFVKRTNGEERRMNARLGVKKHLKGGEIGYNPKAHRLISVFDMQKNGYRMINTDTIFSLKIDGFAYEVG